MRQEANAEAATIRSEAKTQADRIRREARDEATRAVDEVQAFLNQVNEDTRKIPAAADERRRQMLEETRTMQERLLSVAKALDSAFDLALGRTPTPAERQLAQEFLARQQTVYSNNVAEQPLTDLCQMLLASNLFLYLE